MKLRRLLAQDVRALFCHVRLSSSRLHNRLPESRMRRSLDRRSFLESSAATGAAIAGGSYFVSESPAADNQVAGEKIVVALMGVNGRGSELARAFMDQPNCEIGYICDVDENVLN